MSDSEKKYSAEEVAKMVLAKAHEMLEKSTLMKSEKPKSITSHESGLHKVEYFSSTPFEKHQGDYGFEPFHKSEVLSKGTAQPAPSIALNMSEKMDKHGLSPTQVREKMASPAGKVAGGPLKKDGGSAAFPTSRIDTGFGRIIAKNDNPDEKEDAKLGEDVEHLCEDHFKENADAERKEGHKLVAKSECTKCMAKHALSPEQIKAKMKKNENVPTVSEDKGQGDTLRRSPEDAKWQMDKSENFSDLYEILETLEKGEKSEAEKVKAREARGMRGCGNHDVYHQKGVNEPSAGGPAAHIANKRSKQAVRQSIDEMRQIKPNLPKSEEMDKHALSPAQIKAKMASPKGKVAGGSLNKYEDGQNSGIHKKPSDSLNPRIKEDGYDRVYNDFETEPGKGKSSKDDHRQVDQPAPLTNPTELREGNNPEPGEIPGSNGRHKLKLFHDHIMAKRAMKKGICLG